MASLSDRFCPIPFERIQLHTNYAFPCCPSWIKFKLPRITPENLAEVWNGPEMRAQRQGVLDGSYSMCKTDVCPYICAGTLPKKDNVTDAGLVDIIRNGTTVMPTSPKNIQFSQDRSCNLSCPSCRTERYQDRDAASIEASKSWIRGILESAPDCDTIFMTGSGDPFAGRAYREFLIEYRGNHRFELMTNGLLLTPRMWEGIQHLSIRMVKISIDAASPGTYHLVRRGGRWDRLMSNLEYLAPRLASRAIPLEFWFVVQSMNHHEMGDMVDLAARFGGRVLFTKIQDWGTYGNDLAKHQPWLPDHPERSALLGSLRDPRLLASHASIGNLRALRDEALGLPSAVVGE